MSPELAQELEKVLVGAPWPRGELTAAYQTVLDRVGFLVLRTCRPYNIGTVGNFFYGGGLEFTSPFVIAAEATENDLIEQHRLLTTLLKGVSPLNVIEPDWTGFRYLYRILME